MFNNVLHTNGDFPLPTSDCSWRAPQNRPRLLAIRTDAITAPSLYKSRLQLASHLMHHRLAHDQHTDTVRNIFQEFRYVLPTMN